MRGPLLPLPGFMPDAVPFASRLACALLLAYFVAFLLQLDTASSAGVCVGVVMQPAPGMAMSKAFYRTVGTIVGGAVAIVLVGAFPQDRTMLLAALALWMGICSYTATVLRDFRSYGAALSGYTACIIDVIGIDTPNGAMISTLNRVAAILVGVASVALVNSLFTVESDREKLEAGLRGQLDIQRRTAQDALSGRKALADDAYLQQASDILALRTQATYASAELGDGRKRHLAAESIIAAMLNMLAASRAISRLWPADGLSPAVRACFDAVSEAIQRDQPLLPGQLPAGPLDAMLAERATSLAGEHRNAQAWLRAVATGAPGPALQGVRLHGDPDRVAALLNAVRTVIAFGLGSVFCVLGGVSGVGLLLVEIAALTTLLATQPNPSKAATGPMMALPIGAVLAGVVNFLVLPLTSGFVPFALAVAPAAFIVGLAFRNKVTVKIGPTPMIFFTLLLGPSNMETFDLSSFLNEVLNISIAVGLTFLTFRLILPVRPSQRLFRAADKVAWSLRRTLRWGGAPSRTGSLPQSFDRLSQALLWVNARQAKRPVLMSRLCDLAELEASLRRAWLGLRDAESGSAGALEDIRAARAGLASAEPDRLDQAAMRLLAAAGQDAQPDAAVLRAVSGLYESKLLLEQQHHALVSYGMTGH